jgi:Ribonuclease G/E
MIKNFESVSIEIERAIKKLITVHDHPEIEVVVHPQMDDYLSKGDKKLLEQLAKNWKGEVVFKQNDALHLNSFEFYSLNDRQKIEW